MWAVFKIQGFVCKRFLPSFPSIHRPVILCSRTAQKRLLRRLDLHKQRSVLIYLDRNAPKTLLVTTCEKLKPGTRLYHAQNMSHLDYLRRLFPTRITLPFFISKYFKLTRKPAFCPAFATPLHEKKKKAI